MPTFNDLPFEIRERIIVYALYRTYSNEELGASLKGPHHSYAIYITANLKLGQRTLSALKLTSTQTYTDTIAASREWLDYEMIDLFEQLEAVNARLSKHARTCRSMIEYNSTAPRKDPFRRHWISEKSFFYLEEHRRRLERSEHRTWKRLFKMLMGTESIEGFYDFMCMAEGARNASRTVDGRLASPKPRSFRQRELLVCFGNTIDIENTLDSKVSEILNARSVANWENYRELPASWSMMSPLTFWWGPYRRQNPH